MKKRERPSDSFLPCSSAVVLASNTMFDATCADEI
jgi:hypothetical protein